jgi:adenosylcobinamide kinase/adenosylcobinamide-phosphate guanylyltransferase
MMAGRDAETAMEQLLQAAGQWAGPVLLVSNEVGLGGIAGHPMARAFADHAGRLHQGIATRAQRVVLVVAGLPLTLKT